MKANYKKLNTTLEKSTNILNSSLTIDETLGLVLKELKEILNYDQAGIFYLEGNSFQLKKSVNITKDCLNEISEAGLESRKLINTKKAYYCNKNTKNTLLTELLAQAPEMYSYIAAPLMIKGTLFGVIVAIKEELDYFPEEDLTITVNFASVAAYAIKDAELADVMKIQLKTLKNAVSEKNRANEIITLQNEKLLEADKVKNEFLANISHELRTPLNAIIGCSEALKMRIFGDLNPKQLEYSEDIHSSGIHLLGLINAILDLSKIEAKEMRLYRSNFNVLQVTDEVLAITKTLADKKDISLSLDCKDKKFDIYADQQKYQQIMYNLLSNAIKFTDNGGKVKVEIKTTPKKLKVSINDNGIGIDEKYHGKIFAKFQQVDNSYTRKYSSTGLGLTITKEFVEMHGGKIWLESKLGKGSTFIFEIPAG